jgi:hypothetical protein
MISEAAVKGQVQVVNIADSLQRQVREIRIAIRIHRGARVISGGNERERKVRMT